MESKTLQKYCFFATYANKKAFFIKNVRIAFGRNRQNKSEAANFLCHIIKRHAVSTGDVLFGGVVFPRTEDKNASCGDAIKETGRGFVIIAEAVVGEEDDWQFFGKEDNHDFFLFRRDKW